MKERIIQEIQQSILIKEQILKDRLSIIERIVLAITNAFRWHKKLLIFGNGGSAADAQHLAAEFVARFSFDRPGLPAIALTSNSSILTAIGNDYGFDQVFARQITALAEQGDVAIGISTSGNSPNVIAGLQAARQRGCLTIAFTGENGGNLAKEAEIHFAVPSAVTPRIQEAYLMIGHITCGLVEAALFTKNHG